MSSTSTTMSLGNPVVQNLQSEIVRKKILKMKSLKEDSNIVSNHACPLELGFSADDIFFSLQMKCMI